MRALQLWGSNNTITRHRRVVFVTPLFCEEKAAGVGRESS